MLGGALNRPMMNVRLSPTADRPTASGQDRPTASGQGRPMASGQEKQGERQKEESLGALLGGRQLAEIANSSGEIIGCGAICGDHHDDAEDTRTCKKQVTIGRSGLTTRDLMLRLKRWLIAGLDDSDWEGGPAAHHACEPGREVPPGLCRGVV